MPRPRGWTPGPGVNPGGRPTLGDGGRKLWVNTTDQLRRAVTDECRSPTVKRADAIRAIVARGLAFRDAHPGAACRPADAPPPMPRVKGREVRERVMLTGDLAVRVRALAEAEGVPMGTALGMLLVDGCRVVV